MNLRTAMIYIEALMINDMDPIFLQTDFQNGFIYLFIVCEKFKYYTISERIEAIFALLKYDCPEILKQHPVIVEAFDEPELMEMTRNVKQVTSRKK